MQTDFHSLTEIPGAKASPEQLDRMFTRYHFASLYSAGKRVLEVACGSGQGLGYLAKTACFVAGGDYTMSLLKVAHAHYGARIPLCCLDAQRLPFQQNTFDVLILYEAVYYLREPERFIAEAARILTPGGILIISLPNRSLPDFHASPYSFRYFTPPELDRLMALSGFHAQFFGNIRVDQPSLKGRILSFVKKSFVQLNLMPRTLKGREFLKRIAFGRLETIPSELKEDKRASYQDPVPIPLSENLQYRVIFAVAGLGR